MVLGENQIMTEAILADLMSELGIAVLERRPEGSFKSLGILPDWFCHLYPKMDLKQRDIRLEGLTPFLDGFFLLAEPFWRNKSSGGLKSGSWIEIDSSGKEHRLEAVAVCVGRPKLLLIELFGSEFDKMQSLLQKAREKNLAYDYLAKDVQNLQTLISSIAYDMSESLVGINRLLSILDPNKLSVIERQFLDISRRKMQKLDLLIQELKEKSTLGKAE